MSKEILLSRGFVTTVDDADYEWLSKYKWHTSDQGYARRRSTAKEIKNGEGTSIRMSRQILGLCKGELCDHINGDKLDNRRCNLRKATKSQNSMNRPKPANNTSGYKGVRKSRWTEMWVAQIRFNNRSIHLGTFETIDEAIKAYDAKAKELFGEYVAQSCKWAADEDGIWHSKCGSTWILTDGGPAENKMVFCLKCGKKIEVKEMEEEVND